MKGKVKKVVESKHTKQGRDLNNMNKEIKGKRSKGKKSRGKGR